ncbi:MULTISPECIES: TetR/AcrR family transcriptional regulator [unclassified Nocardia]|uniref:TetR/AcrR family transcriptional regulator n=1 Tax=unclassified Nocardia TaxID=2637762 RepID=UPI001CE46466|nr:MULTISPECIES: TetR/AcrR family transcriptional regulator [unclassified Nocardia]
MPTKRDIALDAAIELLGTRGPRALTHRAVDELAGLPAGSTSNYFRTREALLIGIVERLEQHDYAYWEVDGNAPAPHTVDQLAHAATTFVEDMIGANQASTLARYALLLEVRHMPEPRLALRRGHERIVDWATAMLGEFGVAEPRIAAKQLIDYLDGLILHQLTSPTTDFDVADAVSRMVRALLS